MGNGAENAAPGELSGGCWSAERLMVGGKPAAVCFNKFVAQFADVIDRQLCGSMRVEQGGMVDGFAFARHRRFDGQQLSIYVGPVQRCQLLRQIADVARRDALAIDQARDFDAGLGR